MLTEPDRAHWEKIAAQQERPWFERRGLDYALLATGLLVLVGALRDAPHGTLGLSATGGFLIGVSLTLLLRSRDQRILAALWREANRAGDGGP
jgi:hypothetical protein